MNDLPSLLTTAGIAVAVILCLGLAAAVLAIRSRNMQYWLPSYCRRYRSRTARRTSRANAAVEKTEDGPVSVFIAVCDHFEPECDGVIGDAALDRVRRWHVEYPERFKRFQDCQGTVPQHTFFFPQEEYSPAYLDLLAELREAGYGDVDVHLHHDGDTAASLKEKLESFRETLFHRHGLLRRDLATGEIVYGFIHGNWALCNSRPDGRWCGVPEEIKVLRETGCYADLTMPSAPSATQTRTINSIYYAFDRPGQARSHDTGLRATVGTQPPGDGLLMIQGPLVLDWQRRKWGIMPRIENADLHEGHPATWSRFQLWKRANVHVAGRPDWLFVKIHTHGCKDGNIDMLLGEPMQRFHEELSRRAKTDASFRYYYVTAWEMAQLVHQAETGVAQESVEKARSGVLATV